MRAMPAPRRSLRLAALGLAAGLIVAGCSSDDGVDQADYDAEVERADAAEEQAAEAAAEAETLAADLETANADLEQANADLEEAAAELDDTTSTLEALAASETIRADTAEDEIQRFSDLFPIEVESTLEGIELEQEGTWNLEWVDAYCDFETCPSLTTSQATLVRTPEDFLRVQVPGVLDAGIFAVEGSLYAIVDSDTTTLTPCPDGTPRDARVTMTVYADNIVIDADGNRSVTGLEGAITLDARTVNGCSGGVAFYGVRMTRP